MRAPAPRSCMCASLAATSTSPETISGILPSAVALRKTVCCCGSCNNIPSRSEEHTSELQSRENLVCRLLLEKKKKNRKSREVQHQSTKYTEIEKRAMMN